MPRTSPAKAPREAARTAAADLEAARDALGRLYAARRLALDALAAARRTAYAENPGLYLSADTEAILNCIHKAVKALETY